MPSPSADPIQHVVLLILENHSFDQMLGCFQEKYPKLDGIDAAKPPRSNPDDSGNPVFQKPTTERQMQLDPHHEVVHVKAQLEDCNSGFVKNFIASHEPRTEALQLSPCIMGYYPRGFLPALHTLAENFAVCDHWFSSLPGPTWPNRFFALTGTSSGKHDMPEDGAHKSDLDGFFEQNQDTIFDRLSGKGIHWKVYFHDIPQTWVLRHQREPENAMRYFSIDHFYKDARGLPDDFPAFCLIEPDYNGTDENDDHPPHDIMKAEKLIADVYNALRANQELWRSTLLVVFYDEHGGFYDHVSPPKAVFPDEISQSTGYPFDRLGVRVPALLVSPWVDAGLVDTQFDHTSLLKYLCDKWGLAYLGQRTAEAKTIAPNIRTTGAPRQDTPAWIQITNAQLQPPDPEVEEEAANVMNAHHIALSYLADYLKAQVDEEVPVAVSAWSRVWEEVKGLFHPARLLAETPLTPAQRYEHAQEVFPLFLKQQKQKAVSVLADKIRDTSLPDQVRRHAARALGEHVGRRFHREADPLASATRWLEKHHH